MKLLVGVHAGSFSGIDSYAEQVAIAAATAGFDVTLLATDRAIAEDLAPRVEPRGIQVDHLSLSPLSPRAAMLERFWPSASVGRIGGALARYADSKPAARSVWHLNRPALALDVRRAAQRVSVAGWFFPHQAIGRIRETWRHVGGSLVRRAVITGKSLDFYRWDQAGYEAADWIVVPTRQLGHQLQAQGRRVVVCPPPATSIADPPAQVRSRSGSRFVVCSGDLSHPRKNLIEAIAALGQLSEAHGPVTLAAVGRNPEPLLRFAADHAPSVTVEALGLLAPAEVRRVMQGADAFLFPSRYEEWGYVAVESLLCGTPVITYPVYPFVEMLSGGLGEIAEDLRPSSFTAAIERSFSLPRGSALRQAAAARFGSEAVGQRLAPLWRGEPGFEP
jgi:glycosyltransferase involved in cell wall biosynthesis